MQWWAAERVDGPAHVLAHAPLGRPALYVRANTPLPLWPALAHTGEAPDPLTLRIACAPGAPPGHATHYEDEGEGFAHEEGVYARRRLDCEVAGDGAVRVRIGAREGAGRAPRARLLVELRGVESAPARVLVDGAEHAAWAHDDGILTVTLPERDAERTVEVR